MHTLDKVETMLNAMTTTCIKHKGDVYALIECTKKYIQTTDAKDDCMRKITRQIKMILDSIAMGSTDRHVRNHSVASVDRRKTIPKYDTSNSEGRYNMYMQELFLGT